MPVVDLVHITKSFGAVKAVEDVSFGLEKGEFFGLLGPNGAGKTTSLRVMLDIFKPDAGSVAILGGAMSEAKKNRIGYMPEERGLYQDIPLERCLAYLGSLKGMNPADVKRRSRDLSGTVRSDSLQEQESEGTQQRHAAKGPGDRDPAAPARTADRG